MARDSEVLLTGGVRVVARESAVLFTGEDCADSETEGGTDSDRDLVASREAMVSACPPFPTEK